MGISKKKEMEERSRSNLLQMIRRKDQLIDKLQKEIKMTHALAEAARIKRGRAGRYFSRRGGMELAAQRVIMHTSSWAVGVGAKVDAGHKAVLKYQAMLQANLLAGMKAQSDCLALHTKSGNLIV